MATSFDFDGFASCLYDAAKAAFSAIQRTHEGEAFYSFALFTSGDMAYVFPTASTEQGLTQVAHQYFEKGEATGSNLQQERDSLRWSPGDSPLHMEGQPFFEAVNKLTATIGDIVGEFPEDSWDEFDAFVAQFMTVCINVLKRLDAEGLFGRDDQRNAITLNILMGDQSDEEMLKYAKLLNPPPAYERFRKELSSGQFQE